MFMTMNDQNKVTEGNDPLTSPEKEAEEISFAEEIQEHPPQSEAESKNNRVQELEEELAKAKDQTLRALAELENIRKRAMKDREEASAYGISKFARDLLNVSDNLRRALEAVPEDLIQLDERIPGVMSGIEATERELLKCFEQNGIKKLEPLNERFDPNFHEVMFEAPMPDKPNGTVIQVVEAGYVLKGRLLRAAKVGIAKNVAPPPGDDGHLVDQEA